MASSKFALDDDNNDDSSSSSHQNNIRKMMKKDKKKRKKRKSFNGDDDDDDSSSNTTSSRTKNKMIKIQVEVDDQPGGAAGRSSGDPIVCSFPAGMPRALMRRNNSSNRKKKRQQQQQQQNNGATENDDDNIPPPPKFLWKVSDEGGNGRCLIGKDVDNRCTYNATVAAAAPKTQQKRKSRLCIGVYDKRTRTVTLRQAACDGRVFALHQSVPAYLQQTRSNNNNNNNNNNKDARDSYRALFADFGSAQKQKVMKSKEANIVNLDQMVGAGKVMTSSFLDGSNMSESNKRAVQERASFEQQGQNGSNNPLEPNSAQSVVQNVAQEEWRRRFLPPQFEPGASDPAKVYSAKKIAGKEAWEQVSYTVDSCLSSTENLAVTILEGFAETHHEKIDDADGEKANKNTHEHHILPSMKNLIEELAAAVGSGPHVEKQLKCAVLLCHFANLYVKLRKRRFIREPNQNLKRFNGAPMSVGLRFLERFATATVDLNSGFVMSKANKDSCGVQMLLLYLMAASSGHNMRVDNLRSFCEDLEMETKDAALLLRLAGCTTTVKGNKLTAFLTTPLVFPPPPRRGGRK